MYTYATMARHEPDFFLHSGDTIYADGPMKDERGNAHDLAAALRIELKGQSVEFRFFLTNRTATRIPEVWYPALGGLHGFGPAEIAAKTTLNRLFVASMRPLSRARFCQWLWPSLSRNASASSSSNTIRRCGPPLSQSRTGL